MRKRTGAASGTPEARSLRLLPLLLLLVLLAGCGGGEAPPVSPEATPSPALPPVEETPAPMPEPTPEPTPTPTPEPTPAPTPEPAPTPAPEPEPSPAAVPIPELTPDPEQEDVTFVPPVSADAFFDGSLFIGDSILEGIRLYVVQRRAAETTLGSAEFLTSQAGIALKDLLGERDWGLGYRYQGESLPLEEILSRIAPARVFLLLGLNDLADEDGNDAAAVVERYGRFLDKLREWLPEAELTVLLNPPKVASAWLPDYTANRAFSNELIREFDRGLRALCEEREIPWVDLYAALADEDGNLPDQYCRDGFLHLSSEGAALAVQALYDYASEKGAEP